MNEQHNRGSPRLQFSKEELENDALSRPIAKAEKAADRYDKARKKLKKHYRLRLSREEAEPAPAADTLWNCPPRQLRYSLLPPAQKDQNHRCFLHQQNLQPRHPHRRSVHQQNPHS